MLHVALTTVCCDLWEVVSQPDKKLRQLFPVSHEDHEVGGSSSSARGNQTGPGPTMAIYADTIGSNPNPPSLSRIEKCESIFGNKKSSCRNQPVPSSRKSTSDRSFDTASAADFHYYVFKEFGMIPEIRKYYHLTRNSSATNGEVFILLNLRPVQGQPDILPIPDHFKIKGGLRISADVQLSSQDKPVKYTHHSKPTP